jgi:general secretion pathway protein D
MKSNTITTILALALVGSAQPVCAGSQGDGYYAGSIEAASEREITRRQEDMVLADQAIKAGDAARSRKEAEAAYNYYKQAVDMVPQGSAGGSIRSRAVAHFSRGAVEYAEYLVSRGEYAEARRVASEILKPRYNPDYRPAIVFLSHLEEADYFNKTITPEFAAQRDEVNTLINEAVGFYDSGRYDMAQKRYQQVLAIDKDNAAAYRGLEQVELGKQRYYDSAYNETRARMLWQVEKAWERPKRRFSDSRSTVEDTGADERRGTELMLARLNRIIIPRVEFGDTPIQEAIGFLRRQSRTQDTADGGEGINIVLELPQASAAPAVPTVEGEETVAPARTVSDRITLKLSNVPLYEALRYVALQAGLKVKVEPFAVSVVPLTKMTDTLEVREFRVPPGFISASAGPAEDNATFAGGGSDGATVGTKLSARQNAKDFLDAQGVEFPTGASARFIPGSSRLVVKNTASNLDLIQALVEAAMAEQPTQVEIEAKFVEVSQNNLKELGFDWTLGPLSIGGGVYGGGGNGVAAGRSFPFNYPGTTVPVGENTLTGGLRSGSGTQPYSALSVNSLNALLAQSLGLGTSGGPAPGIFSVAGVFTNPQFQVMIRALNQKKGVDLMAAPKVTTKSGQKATITLNRQFPYPQAYDPPQIPQSSGNIEGNNININFPGAQRQVNDPVVTPSFPTEFTTRNLGVTLEVEPQIGPDGYTIDLNLTPEVVDFEGFINYGSPIYAPQPIQEFALVNDVLELVNVRQERTILTENVINQPIFSTRKVTTNVSIWDGQTVVIGGLIREDVQKVNDKVPILGDIPLAGVLFRSEVEQKIKRNLIIFTTARLMDAAGQLLRPEDDSDQEEVVEPLGLPPEVPLPVRGNPKGLTRK